MSPPFEMVVRGRTLGRRRHSRSSLRADAAFDAELIVDVLRRALERAERLAPDELELYRIAKRTARVRFDKHARVEIDYP